MNKIPVTIDLDLEFDAQFVENKIRSLDKRILYANVSNLGSHINDTIYCRLGFRYTHPPDTKQYNGWQPFHARTFNDLITQIKSAKDGFELVITDDPHQRKMLGLK